MTLIMGIISPKEPPSSVIYGPLLSCIPYQLISRAINHSPEYYPNPHAFDPRCFLCTPSKEYSHSKPFPSEKSSPSFGWGRRICPGEHLAKNSVFISIAKICLGTTIRKHISEKTGQVEEPDT